MARIKEFPLPDLGEGLTEGEILRWLVQVGDTVTLNQPLVEVETAKAAVEIPAKWAGTVTRIYCDEGTTVAVGSPIIAIDTEPGSAEPPPPPAPPKKEERETVLVGYGPRSGAATRRLRVTPEGTPGVATVGAPAPDVASPTGPANGSTATAVKPPAATALAKPPVRKLARDLGVDLHTVVGTGPHGSITRQDLAQATAAPATEPGNGRERRVPVKGVRKLTAANMVASAFTAPHVTEFLTVDMTRSTRALDRLRKVPEWRDVRVSPLLMVAKAVLVALRRYPMMNSTWAGEEIIVKDYVNLGIAAATDRGLIVPNIPDAGSLSLRELADGLNALVATAKDGRTTPAAMTGGTFTITNVGVFGVDTGTPILPPGEAAILALGAVREAAWVHKGKVKPRQVTTLGLSFDHRIVDGELGSRFLRDVGSFLTDPEAALLAWA